MGLHTLAYGGKKPAPFQQGICESQALEPGITGDFTRDEMQLLVDKIGCSNSSDLNSPETIACLRDFDTTPLLDASVAVHSDDISNNIGDSWLPAVDGDFLPDAPSKLVREGRFSNITTMIGYTDADVQYYTSPDIRTARDTHDFVASYMRYMSPESVRDLLALYPSSDFPGNPPANVSGEFYRSARIFRDIIMTCMPTWYGANLARNGLDVFLFDFNQTMLAPILAAIGSPGLGPVHTSEFAYVFGNISHYDNLDGYPFAPTDTDRRLEHEAALSWASFASRGKPSLRDKKTLQGWEPAFFRGGPTDETDVDVFVVGGANEGLTAWDGPHSTPAMAAQKLRERCGFLNSPEIQLQMKF